MKREEREMPKPTQKRTTATKTKERKFGDNEHKALRCDRKFLNLMKGKYIKSLSNEYIKKLADNGCYRCFIEMKRREQKKGEK